MKNKIKFSVIALVLILLIILSSVAIIAGERTTPNEDKNWKNGTVVDDKNKTAAVLDENNTIEYKARKISTHNNMYCAQRTLQLDSYLAWRDNVKFRARAMADIKGDTATFYTYKYDANGNLTDTTSLGTVTSRANNIMAGIVAEENPNSLVDVKDIDEYLGGIYKGYGKTTHKCDANVGDDGMPICKCAVNTTTRYSNNFTITQIAVHTYFETWWLAIGTDKGFYNDYFEKDKIDHTASKQMAADQYITAITKEINNRKKI